MSDYTVKREKEGTKMATYKDDLDILKAAEKDSNKLSLNAITELDNKGLLGMYGGGGSSTEGCRVRFILKEDISGGAK